MSSNPQAPRPTINGNNSNVDAMLAKLNQRLNDLAANIGVVPQVAQAADALSSGKPPANVLTVTSAHVNALGTAHGTLDDIEATLGPKNS